MYMTKTNHKLPLGLWPNQVQKSDKMDHSTT